MIQWVNDKLAKQFTWSEWLEYRQSPPAFTANGNGINIKNFRVDLKSTRLLNDTNHVASRIFNNSSKTLQSLQQRPVRIWDVKYSGNSGVNTYNHPAVMKAYGTVITPTWNFGTMSKFGLSVIMPSVFTGLDASDRLTVEKIQYPGYSGPAHYGAVGVNMAIDYGLIAQMLKFGPPGLMIPLFGLINLNCEIAHGLRHISTESLVKNKEIGRSLIISGDHSPELEAILLADLERGGSLSEKYIRAAIQVTKTSYKPFEWLHIVKKSAGDLTRELANRMSLRKPIKPLPATNERNDYKPESSGSSAPVDDPEVIAISKGIETCVNQAVPTRLSLTPTGQNSVSPQASYHGQVSLLQNTDNQIVMTVGMGSTVLTPDFHQFFNVINSTSDQNVSVATASVEPALDVPEVTVSIHGSTGSSFEHKKDKKSDVPFISDIKIGKVDGKLGLVAEVLGAAATVGVTASKGGFTVEVVIKFGPEFWSALGASLGVGAAVAGVLLAAKFFVDKHQKHVVHKIKADVKSTNKDIACINNALQNLHNALEKPDATRNIDALLAQTNALMKHITTRVRKEQERGDYAKDHDRKNSKKSHRNTAGSYKDIYYNLSTLRKSLMLEKVQQDFINKHSDASDGELLALAKNLIAKFYTPEEAAAASKRESDQPDPFAQIDSYHSQGYKLYYHVNGNTRGGHLTPERAKEAVENGWTIEVKKGDKKAWVGMPAKTFSETELAKIAALRALIVDKTREFVKNGEMTEAENFLEKVEKFCELSTKAADLKLNGLINFIRNLIDNTDQPPSYWINELQNVNNGTKVLGKDEKLLLEQVALNKLINAAINNALEGKFETANTILQKAKSALTDLSEDATNLMAKLKELQPILGDIDKCLEKLAANEHSKDRKSTLDNVVEDILLTSVIENTIFSHVSKGECDKAEEYCGKFMKASPKSAETFNDYISGINILKALKEKPNQVLLEELEKISNSNTKTINEKKIILSTLPSWILNNVMGSVLNGKKEDAIHDLEQLKQKDSKLAILCDRLLKSIANGNGITNKGESVLLDEYGELLAKQKALVSDSGSLNKADPNDVTVNDMEIHIRLNALLTIAFDKANRGFNYEAAESIANLRKKNPFLDEALKLVDQEEDFSFADSEQIASFYIRSVQSMAFHFVHGLEHSPCKRGVLAVLNALNAWQVIAPLPLTARYMLAKLMRQDKSPAIRSGNALLARLGQNLNLVRTKNYYNSALFYTQLFLKAGELIPLNWIISDKRLYKSESIRSSILYYGHTGLRIAHIITTALQIYHGVKEWSRPGFKRFANDFADVPSWIATLLNVGSDVIFWGISKSMSSRGAMPEDPDSYYYLAQDAFGSVMEVWNAFESSRLITRDRSSDRTADNVGAWHLLASVYGMACTAGKKNRTAKALQASCENINYFRNIQSILQYTNTAKISLIQGIPTQEDMDRVKNYSEIIFEKSGSFYTIYVAGENNSILQRYVNDYDTFLDDLDWPNKGKLISVDDESLVKKIKSIVKKTTIRNCPPEDIIDEVLRQCLISSLGNIEKNLNAVFGGLTYISDDPGQESANFARITHLSQMVKIAYDRKDYDKVIELTEKFPRKDGKILINKVFQFPPHLIWQLILFYRLTAFIESPTHLAQFKNQYEEYSQYIKDSANNSKPWYYTYWESVEKHMWQILDYAMQKFILAAHKAKTGEEQLQLLSMVPHYHHWELILTNDELKLAAASILYDLGKFGKCVMFLDAISTAAFYGLILDDINNKFQFADILERAAHGGLPVTDKNRYQKLYASYKKIEESTKVIDRLEQETFCLNKKMQEGLKEIECDLDRLEKKIKEFPGGQQSLFRQGHTFFDRNSQLIPAHSYGEKYRYGAQI